MMCSSYLFCFHLLSTLDTVEFLMKILSILKDFGCLMICEPFLKNFINKKNLRFFFDSIDTLLESAFLIRLKKPPNLFDLAKPIELILEKLF